jgi:hypothetical protein
VAEKWTYYWVDRVGVNIRARNTNSGSEKEKSRGISTINFVLRTLIDTAIAFRASF